MCGIAGFLGSTPDAVVTLTEMVAAIRHRGPDASNNWISDIDPIALTHARLSVVDLAETGAQPMRSHSRRYMVSYNGELYNHNDLRQELNSLDSSIPWRGTSDTETLVASLDAFGIDTTLNKCIGMFAIAIWDLHEKQLTLVVDRFGEKPLYFQPTSDGVIFGSEISAVERHPASSRQVSQIAVRELAETLCIPAPLSIYEGLYKLLPGTSITFGLSGYLDTVQWWSPISTSVANAAAWEGSEAEALVALETKLEASVQRQMMADVPLGSFLSGGIDSSLITALMQKNRDTAVKTFSIGFEKAEFDEAKYAAKVADHLGTDHTEYYISDNDICQLVPDISTLFSEPFADSSQLPTYLLSKLSRNDVTVALTGDAGDEIFAGYSRHTFTRNHWPKIKKIPTPLRKIGAGLIGTINEARLDWLFGRLPITSDWTRVGEKLKRTGHVLGATEIQELHRFSTRIKNSSHVNEAASLHTASDDALGPQAGLFKSMQASMQDSLEHLDDMRWMMVRDQTSYLPNDILVKVDRASMACALETRAPFLDHTLVEFTQQLPSSMFTASSKGKVPLRTILDKYVPRQLIDRPKMGFAIPIHEMLRGPLRDWAESLLSNDRLREAGGFDADAVARLWTDHLQGTNNNISTLWPILMFQSWVEGRRSQ